MSNVNYIQPTYEFDISKEPVFQITTLETNKKINIYFDGRVEGFGEKIRIFNLIPSIDAGRTARAKHNLLLEMAKALAEVIANNDDGGVDKFLTGIENKCFYGSEQGEGLNSVSDVFFSSDSVEEK